jgi:ComEC/Rec2-related protein
MVLALTCIAALACGWLAPSSALPLLLALACAGMFAGLAHRERPVGRTLALAGLFVCLGLLRGASVGPPAEPRVPERGLPGAGLRSFEVIGASEPGPRCTFALREPDTPGAATLTVSAPMSACPRSSGEQIAVLAPALRPTWEEALVGRATEPIVRGLGRPPVIWRRATTSGWRPLASYWHWVAARRQRAWSSSRGDPAAALVVAAGLGLRSALPPGHRDELRLAGLGHLIAVSGLHVAIAALWLQAVARRGAALLGLSPARACVVAWLPLWAYVGLTGAAASAVRAAVMLTAVDLGTLAGRPVHGPTTLACVAATMLLLRPDWLGDPGFALSLAAMAAIVSAPPDLGVLAMSWRITWATAPLSVIFFDVAPLHGLLGNALALPLFGLMMPAALVASVVPGPLGVLALEFAKLFAVPILDLAALLARLPAAGPAGLLVLAGLGLALGLALRSRGSTRDVAEHPRVFAWLPPQLACVLAVAISAVLLVGDARARRAPHPPSFDWIALGTPRSRSLLVRDPSHQAAACLYRPTGSSATWRALLGLHDIRELSRLDADLPRTPDPDAPEGKSAPPRTDPRTRALARALERAGIRSRVAADACRPPPAAEVRAALRACQFLQGGRGRALARSWAGARSCRIEDRWVLLPVNSD